MNGSFPFAGNNQGLFLAASDIPGIQRIVSKFHFYSAMPILQIRWSQSHMEILLTCTYPLFLFHPACLNGVILLLLIGLQLNLGDPFISLTTPIPTFISKDVKSEEVFPCRTEFTLQLKDHFTTSGWIGRDKARGRAGGHLLVTVMQMGGNKLVNMGKNLISDP